MNVKPFRIAVLISGGGSTLLNLIHNVDSGQLSVEIGLVISSNPNARGLEYAKEAGIPVQVVRKANRPDNDKANADSEYSEQIFGFIRESEIQLVVMGGFLKHVLIPDDFVNRVINIHPSLIPAFSGAGFYGLKVHQAVIDKGCKVSGCTVHFVDNIYDHGPIIDQVAVEVLDEDSADSLQRRVFEAECKLYPKVIQRLSESI